MTEIDTHTLLVTTPDGQTLRVRVSKPQIVMGRSALNDVVIDDPKASRSHARLHFGESVLLEDLGSTNGTLVGDERITSHRMAPGETFRIGGHRIQVGAPASVADFDRTQINNEGEIDKTIADNPMEEEVNDTSIARVAITMRGRTWEVPLDGDATVFGRGSECSVPLESSRVSRAHAQVERVGDRYRVRDLGSSNGTWMGGRRITQEFLHDGAMFTIGDAHCVFKAGFLNEELTVVDGGTRPSGARRPVVFVPGMMGSTLYAGSELVWPNVRRMLTDPTLFAYPGSVPLTPGGLVTDVVVVPGLIKQNQYSRLSEFLCETLAYEVGKDLLTFPYDWRQDVRISAKQLGAAIEGWGVREPITIVAHSLGALVTRYYLDCLGGSRRVNRVVFLGGGHYGTPKSLVLISEGPGFLPFGLLAEKARSILMTFPAVYQILPAYAAVQDQAGQPIDVIEDNRWLTDHQKPLHAIARDFRRELPNGCSVSAVSIFGYGITTVSNVSMSRDSEGRYLDMEFTSDETGDSVVPQAASVLKGTEIHPVRQYHGALYTDKDVQMRLKVELTS
jgi:pSer/pThr/pTyr-binding forkhead associated (FHA) protein